LRAGRRVGEESIVTLLQIFGVHLLIMAVGAFGQLCQKRFQI
jgi:hypothetical protein